MKISTNHPHRNRTRFVSNTIVVLLSLCVSQVLQAQMFIRGDTNDDGKITIADPIKILQHTFFGEQLRCTDAADFDDNGIINTHDVISCLTYLFIGGTPPKQPFPEAGFDPSPDSLDCEVKEIHECGVITESGYYQLTKSIRADVPDCIEIEADNVTLNGNGHILFYGASGSATGLFVSGAKNVFITNVQFEELASAQGLNKGVLLSFSTQVRFSENIFINSGFNSVGLELNQSVDNRIKGNTFHHAGSGYELNILNHSDQNNVTENKFIARGATYLYGIHINSGRDNQINSNIFAFDTTENSGTVDLSVDSQGTLLNENAMTMTESKNGQAYFGSLNLGATIKNNTIHLSGEQLTGMRLGSVVSNISFNNTITVVGVGAVGINCSGDFNSFTGDSLSITGSESKGVVFRGNSNRIEGLHLLNVESGSHIELLAGTLIVFNPINLETSEPPTNKVQVFGEAVLTRYAEITVLVLNNQFDPVVRSRIAISNINPNATLPIYRGLTNLKGIVQNNIPLYTQTRSEITHHSYQIEATHQDYGSGTILTGSTLANTPYLIIIE